MNYHLKNSGLTTQSHTHTPQQIKVDEYMLGEYDDDLTDTPTTHPPLAQDEERVSD